MTAEAFFSMDKGQYNDLKDVVSEIQSMVQDIRTAINGNDLGTPGLAHELIRHGKDDEKQFATIRAQQEVIIADHAATKMQIAKWGGGLAVLIFICGVVATLAAK